MAFLPLGPGERGNPAHTHRPYRLGHCCCGNSDGRRALSASWEKTLRICENEKVIATFIADRQLTACAITSEGLTFAAGDSLG